MSGRTPPTPLATFRAHVEGCPDCGFGYCSRGRAYYEAVSPEDRVDLYLASLERDGEHLGYSMDLDTFDPVWLTPRQVARHMAGAERLPGPPGGLVQSTVHPDAPHGVKVAYYLSRVRSDMEGSNLGYKHRGRVLAAEEAAELLASRWCRRRVTGEPMPMRALRPGEDPKAAMRALSRELHEWRKGRHFVELFTRDDLLPREMAS